MLLVIRGFAGVGKSTLAREFSKKHDFALLKQDAFVFDMNQASMIKREARAMDCKVGFSNIITVMKNYMDIGKSIVLEGALVPLTAGDPFDLDKVFALAKGHGYTVKLITLETQDKVRKKRQKKRGYVLPVKIDCELAARTGRQELLAPNLVIDTSKINVRQSLIEIESAVMQL